MASFRKLRFLLVCICVLLITCVPESDGRRGGGVRIGSRYRSSRVASRSSYVTGHIRKGSSGYTSNTWKIAAAAGVIYGASRYMKGSYYRRYPDRMPPICTNNFDEAPNGKVYGYFICPLDTDPINYTWCCGPSHQEFCCDEYYYHYCQRPQCEIGKRGEVLRHLETYKHRNNTKLREKRRRTPSRSVGSAPFIIVGVIVALAAVIVVIVYCCRRKRRNAQGGFVFSKQGFMRGTKERTEPLHGVPLKTCHTDTPNETKTDHAGAYHGNQYPPNPATQAAPYPPAEGMYNPPGGPYPPPPGNYYPPSTAPYPTPCGPYPSYPPSTDLPYPPEQVPATTSGAAPPPYPGSSIGTAPAQAYGQPTAYPPYPQQ